MRQELLKAMTWQDLVEIVEETEAVFDDEIYAGKNPNDVFTTPESYYREVMRRLRDKYKCLPPIVERYPAVLDAAQQATGTTLSNSRSRENTFVRCLVSHKLHTEGYSYHEIGKMMKRDHSTITHLFFNMQDMLSVPDAYKKEMEMYRSFMEKANKKDEYLVALFYIGGEAQGSEITLAIEGWRQHFKEPFHLVVIGDKPPYDDVEWFPIERVPGKEGEYRTSLDICTKLEAVCTLCEKRWYDHFIWASDDFFAVNDFTIDDVKFPKYLDDEMPILGVMHPNWFERTQVKTRLLCQKEGFGIKNWTTHLPMWFDVQKLHDLILDYDLTQNGYIVENIYFNAYPPDGEPFKLCLNDRWKFPVIYQPLDREGFQNALKNKIWVCCSVHGWSNTLDRELRKHYGLPDLEDDVEEKKGGYIVIGELPNAKCIRVSYTPSEQELKNMKVIFGMNYMTVDEMEAYEKSRDK